MIDVQQLIISVRIVKERDISQDFVDPVEEDPAHWTDFRQQRKVEIILNVKEYMRLRPRIFRL